MLYKGVFDVAHLPEGGLPEAGGFQSAMELWPSGTDTRQSAEKPLHKAVAIALHKNNFINAI